MPRKVSNQLHVKQIDSLPIGLHADGGGLYFQRTARGASWIYRYTSPVSKSRRDMGLGSYPIRTLGSARLKAQEAARIVLDGGDPIDDRLKKRGVEAKSKIKRTTFEAAAKMYIEKNAPGWRNEKHAWQWTRSLEMFVYPHIGSIPVAQLGVEDVMRCVEPIWLTKSETASRVRGRIETVIGFAIAGGMRDDTRNPATWSLLKHMLPERSKVAPVKHFEAAAIDSMPKVMAAIRAADTMASKALQFAILCASRTSEVIKATWPEIDMEARLWVVPGDRMKSGRAHRVPLSDAAMAILRELAKVAEPGGYVFHGQRAGQPLSNMALIMLLRRVGFGELTAHGFRSTFRDWAAERTNAPSEVAEMALAHVVGDKVEAAYRRGDLLEKRRELADEWAAHCKANGVGISVS